MDGRFDEIEIESTSEFDAVPISQGEIVCFNGKVKLMLNRFYGFSQENSFFR